VTKKKAKGRKQQTPEQEEAIRNLMTAHERLSRFIMNHIWANDDLINVLKLTNGQLAIWKGELCAVNWRAVDGERPIQPNLKGLHEAQIKLGTHQRKLSSIFKDFLHYHSQAAEESRRYQCALRHRLESMVPEVIDKYRPCEEENGKCYRNEGAVQ